MGISDVVLESLKADMALARTRRWPISAYLFPCIFIVAVYRLAHALGTRGFSAPARALQIVGLVLAGANVDWRSELGPGLFFEHPLGVGIGDGVRIGRNVVIGGSVVLGAAHGPSREGGFPTIGDNVQIWTKASVIGPVHVGDGAIIGAHALVVSDVPAGAVARGVPAKCYLDGQLVDSAGRPLDSDGRPVQSHGRPMHADARPVHSDGRRVQSDGQPAEADGQLVER